MGTCIDLTTEKLAEAHTLDTWKCPECVKMSEEFYESSSSDKKPDEASSIKITQPDPAPKQILNSGKCTTCKVLVDEVKRRGEMIESLKATIAHLMAKNEKNESEKNGVIINKVQEAIDNDENDSDNENIEAL